jgi:hypothetical protein
LVHKERQNSDGFNKYHHKKNVAFKLVLNNIKPKFCNALPQNSDSWLQRIMITCGMSASPMLSGSRKGWLAAATTFEKKWVRTQ